ncbi:MAG TPA: hypothetical protein V6D22_06660 [Candidatus Obscuribacterales bacterium]
MQNAGHVSELILLVILLMIVAMTRVYYDDGAAPMVVWKSELSLKDTLVKISEFAKMPRTDLETEHPDVFYQMEDMGLLDSETSATVHRRGMPRPKPKAP